MTDYLEDALAPDDRARFEAHLINCAACTASLDQMRATVATLGELRVDDLPDEVVDELVDLYRRHRAG